MTYSLSPLVRESPRIDSKNSYGQVENLVREAYRNSKKIKTQGERVLLRGNNIEMWVNTKTKTIETAYPIAR